MARRVSRKKKERTRPARLARRAGVMNPTEESYYYNILCPRLAAGEVVKILFEPFKIVLVHPDSSTKRKESTYLPDFYVLRADGGVEIHEVKGFCDEADRLKIKFSAEKFEEFEWYMAHSKRANLFEIERF